MRIVNSCKNFIKRHSGKPAILYGYKIPGGKYLAHTRVSNTTYIGCKKKLDIADHVFIGHYNFLDSCNGLKINEGCQITNYVSILTHSSHIAVRIYGKSYIEHDDLRGYEKGKVELGAYTFVGPHTVIASGSSIGKGSLIAAYSYVKGTFPDFSILSGNPAKVIGTTKNLDERYLRQYPELRNNYDSWASDTVK